MAAATDAIGGSVEDQMRLALDRERRRAARLPSTDRTPVGPGPDVGRLEGEALRQSLVDIAPEDFGASQTQADFARNRRALDAARAVRTPSLPATFPSAAERAAQEAAQEEVAEPEQESRIGRLLRNVREQTSRAIGQSGEGAAGGLAGAAAAPVAAAAERGYGLAWDQLQGWLETMAFTWVGMLIAGPASLIAYGVRLIGGHVVRPKVRGVQIIPPYSIGSFVAHTLPNVLIAIVLGILTLLIVLIVDLLANKCDSALVQTVTADFLSGILKPLVSLLSFLHLC